MVEKSGLLNTHVQPSCCLFYIFQLNASKTIFKLRNELVKNHLLIQKFPIGQRLQIEAEVVEKATGRKEKAIDNSIYFVESPFIINFDKTPKFFKPGLPFEAKVRDY